MIKWIPFLIIPSLLWGETVSEKCARLEEVRPLTSEQTTGIDSVNEKLAKARHELLELQRQAHKLCQTEESEESFLYLQESIAITRREIADIEEKWRNSVRPSSSEDPYALFHQPWTSLEQLVADYGSSDYVYIIPPEVAGIRLTIASQLPVPREAWDELLTLVLTQNGVGIHQLSPFLRQLYLLAQRPNKGTYLTSERATLSTLPPEARVTFVYTPLREVGQIFHALEKFIQKETSTLHLVNHQIFISSSAGEIRELLKLCEFMEEGQASKQWRLLTLDKIGAKEMAQVLELAFPEGTLKALPPEGLPNTLFLIGEREEVARAQEIAEEVEAQIADPKEVTLYTYIAKHSDAQELSETLSKIYPLLNTHSEVKEAMKAADHVSDPLSSHFVVYPKTGMIVMAVEAELLPKLKNLIRQLDIPKKMVKIEVLFFEKKITSSSRFGLDLLKMGNQAGGGNNQAGGIFGSEGGGSGICQFILNQTKKSVIPAYDLIYSFLLSQEDVRINASPSVTTVNHTPAKIQLVEEISIDTGVSADSSTKKNFRSYQRSEYGITLQITPSINPCWGEEGDPETITLEAEVEFDTPKPSKDNRPPVVRRRITNQVRIPNGETVILGGLRSKMDADTSSVLPFLGEIPGIGKLFGSSTMSDHETEMFIFITPTIIEDPVVEFRRSRQDDLCKRPGDIPEFLERVISARKEEKKRACTHSLNTLFGRQSQDRSTGNY